MFLAFFHVVLCVTLSSPSSSPSSLSRQLPSAVRAAALLREPCNAECNSNSKRSEGEGAGVGMVGGAWSTRPTTPPVSGPLFLVSLPFGASPLRCSQSQNQDSQYQAKLSACTQHFPLHCCALANTQCIRWRQAGPGLLWAWPLREFSKLFECYLGLYLCESKRCCNNNFHCKPSTQVQKLTEKK